MCVCVFPKLFALEGLQLTRKAGKQSGVFTPRVPSDSGDQAPSPGKPLGAMKEQSAWAWVQCPGQSGLGSC